MPRSLGGSQYRGIGRGGGGGGLAYGISRMSEASLRVILGSKPPL